MHKRQTLLRSVVYDQDIAGYSLRFWNSGTAQEPALIRNAVVLACFAPPALFFVLQSIINFATLRFKIENFYTKLFLSNIQDGECKNIPYRGWVVCSLYSSSQGPRKCKNAWGTRCTSLIADIIVGKGQLFKRCTNLPERHCS